MKSFVLAVVALSLALGPGEDESFLLAILNRDGLALPFAAFNGRRWKAPWPDHLQVELPISLDSVDKDWWGIGARPPRMRLWAQGAKAGEVSITALAQVRGLCSARVGVRTDYAAKALAPPRLKQPYPKDGLLVSSDVAIGKIEMVERGSEEWNRALVLITDDFNKGELSAIASFGGWRHPVREDARKRMPITIEATYKAPSDGRGWTTYFVEAVRQYRPVTRSGERPDDHGAGVGARRSGREDRGRAVVACDVLRSERGERDAAVRHRPCGQSHVLGVPVLRLRGRVVPGGSSRTREHRGCHKLPRWLLPAVMLDFIYFQFRA